MATASAIPDLSPAIESEQAWKLELDSGLQVVGHLSEQLVTDKGCLSYFNFNGPSELRYENQPIQGQGHARHPHGFSSPVGVIKGLQKPLWQLSKSELIEAELIEGKIINLHFESGIRVSGKLTHIIRRGSKNLITTFEECTVSDRLGRLLFNPHWGSYDMAVCTEAKQIVALS